MKKWKMMALICVLCGSLSGCGLSFCGIPLGKKGTAYVCLWGEECGNAGG